MAHRVSALALATLALSMAPDASHAAQGYDNCTGFIDSVPATITTQGTWCLRKDLSTSIRFGDAITVDANNVTIDCNDFKLGGLSAGPGTKAFGIAGRERQNITVRNCNVRGFWAGITLAFGFGGGHLVERNRLSGNTGIGMLVHGPGSTIQRNRVLDTGGEITDTSSVLVAIAAGGGVDVLDNLVSGVSPAAGSNEWPKGIEAGEGGSVRGNRVRGVLADGAGHARAIQVNSAFVMVSNNQLEGTGGPSDTGIYCDVIDAGAFSGNYISGFGVASQYCVDAGDNTVLGVAPPP